MISPNKVLLEGVLEYPLMIRLNIQSALSEAKAFHITDGKGSGERWNGPTGKSL